ncbi:MAG: hypothetical protein M5U16_08800 [Hyphomicrobium sp.]|nr:hypothetical protein [Hyphomicrobium sp.]
MRIAGNLRDAEGERAQVAAAESGVGPARGQHLRAVAVKHGVDGSEALHRDASSGELLWIEVGRVALGEQPARLLADDAVRIGIEQQPLEALLGGNRAEAEGLDAAEGE